ncbi:hypothetical protein GCM10025794_02150 [Massilia kyonggiensis]
MATRYRWLRINTELKIAEIKARMAAARFSVDVDDGFSFIDSDIRGEIRYYWRTVVTTSYIDHDNSQALVDGRTTSYIRLKNPPRTMSAFLNALERIIGFGFSVENFNVLLHGREELLKRSDSARLVSVKATNVKLADNVIGRVEAVSKDYISNDLLGKFSMYPHLVDFCTYELIHKNVRGQVSFYRNGQARVSENIGGYVLNLVEGVL